LFFCLSVRLAVSLSLQVLLLAGSVLEEKTTTKRRMFDAHWRLYCSRRSNFVQEEHSELVSSGTNSWHEKMMCEDERARKQEIEQVPKQREGQR
jgi:hypothetical protein